MAAKEVKNNQGQTTEEKWSSTGLGFHSHHCTFEKKKKKNTMTTTLKKKSVNEKKKSNKGEVFALTTGDLIHGRVHGVGETLGEGEGPVRKKDRKKKKKRRTKKKMREEHHISSSSGSSNRWGCSPRNPQRRKTGAGKQTSPQKAPGTVGLNPTEPKFRKGDARKTFEKGEGGRCNRREGRGGRQPSCRASGNGRSPQKTIQGEEYHAEKTKRKGHIRGGFFLGAIGQKGLRGCQANPFWKITTPQRPGRNQRNNPGEKRQKKAKKRK